jgi:hypothetical protein
VVSVEPIGDILSHFVVSGIGYLLAATFVDLCILSLHREIFWLERLFRFDWLSPAFEKGEGASERRARPCSEAESGGAKAVPAIYCSGLTNQSKVVTGVPNILLEFSRRANEKHLRQNWPSPLAVA